MAPDRGTVMVLASTLIDCPTASVYGPVTTAADTNVIVAVTVFVGTVMVLPSNETRAFRANTLPSRVAPVPSAIDVYARMLPLKTELPPIVAELPTCQKMLAAWAPPIRTTWRPTVVMSVVPIWKIQTPFGSPAASSVRSPDDISIEV